MAWVRKFWVPTGDENHVTNVAPWILRWTPAQKFLAFYFSLGGNLDKNNVRSFFCHVNALSVISTKQGSWQFWSVYPWDKYQKDIFSHTFQESNVDIYMLYQGRNRLRNRIEAARAQYLPLLWPVRQSGAAVEHNDVILTNLMTSHCFNPIP